MTNTQTQNQLDPVRRLESKRLSNIDMSQASTTMMEINVTSGDGQYYTTAGKESAGNNVRASSQISDFIGQIQQSPKQTIGTKMMFQGRRKKQSISIGKESMKKLYG